MVKNDLNNKRALKKRKQSMIDMLINRMMLAFVFTVAGVTVMLSAGKNIANQARFITYFLPVLLIVSVLALAGAIFFYVKRKKSGYDDSSKIITKANVLGTAIAFLAMMLVYRATVDATAAIITVIGACLLYFIYCFMRRDFAFFTAAMAAAVLLFRAASVCEGTRALIFSIVACIIGVASIIVGVMMASGKGTLKLGAKSIECGNGLVPMLIAGIVLVAGGALGIIGMSNLLVYAIAAALVVYLAALVVYALKMM